MSAARQPAPFANRAPAWPVLIAFIAGIVADRYAVPQHYTTGLGGQLVCLAILLCVWGIARRCCPRLSLAVLLLTVAAAGSVWHHARMSVVAADHIVRYARPEPAAYQLELTLLDAPRLDRETLDPFASAWPDEPKSRFLAEVRGFERQSEFVPASGKTLVAVEGELPAWRAGDSVRAWGTLRELTPPRNPGSYNFAAAMRRDGVLVSLFCESPEALQRTHRNEDSATQQPFVLERIRDHARQTLTATLPADEAAIAIALLLGERDDLNNAQQETFRLSGLAHLLSISGLHVGLFGLAFFACGRLLNLPPRKVALLTAVGMTLCLLAAELRPPVLRAWILGITLLTMIQLQRPVSLIQGLAVSGWAVLLVQPAWLFDSGTHLSFLAVGTILLLLVAQPPPAEWQDEEALREAQPWWLRQSSAAFRLSLGITVVLLPLLGHAFHRIQLAGIPGTVLALPLLTVVMILASVHLLWSMLCFAVAFPGASILTARPATIVLDWLGSLAATFAAVSPLNWFSIRPAGSVVILVYLMAGLALYLRGRYFPLRPRVLIGWTAGVILLFEAPLFAPAISPAPAECRVLSVGHGNACLVKGPDGQCVLLDGGSMENGERAAAAIEASLADMQIDRLAAVVISHTDADHLNAVPYLLDRVPIGRILVNPVGLTPEHSGLSEVAERAVKNNVPLVAFQPGDRIPLGHDSNLEVLQCPPHPLAGTGDDNADSLVLAWNIAGRRVLFPGDVNGAGQQKLLQNATGGFDVLVAPHHGSRRDNTAAFSRWIEPECVVVSSGFDVDRDHLATVYADRPIAITADGAIRLRMDRRGRTQLSQWQPEQRWGPIRSSE